MADQRPIRRVAFIDGYNVMHHYQNMIDSSSNGKDELINPMVFLPLLHSFWKKKICVQIVMARVPKRHQVSNFFIIQEITKMKLLIYPENEEKESDDKIMLSLARTSGGIIVSNDKFNNFKLHATIVRTNTAAFVKEKNPNFSNIGLKKEMMFQYKMKFSKKLRNFYCFPTDPSYEKVKESYELLWPNVDMDVFYALCSYVHRNFRSELKMNRAVKEANLLDILKNMKCFSKKHLSMFCVNC